MALVNSCTELSLEALNKYNRMKERSIDTNEKQSRKPEQQQFEYTIIGKELQLGDRGHRIMLSVLYTD